MKNVKIENMIIPKESLVLVNFPDLDYQKDNKVVGIIMKELRANSKKLKINFVYMPLNLEVVVVKNEGVDNADKQSDIDSE